MPARLGIDIGGTFTDFVLSDPAAGVLNATKTLTTPHDPVKGVLTGLAEILAAASLQAADLATVIHATTLITNAIIERKGAKTALITTEGFRDLLEIGRELRYDLYDIFLAMPEPLVPRRRRLEVRERVDSQGTVVEPLDVDGLRAVVEQLTRAGVESVAVTFLHSYANDGNERRAAEVIASACPELSVSISSEVAREIREFDRLSTTVANAYVRPLAERYLSSLRREMDRLGFGGALQIMLSNGGITTVDSATALPVRLVESGPAAGALVAGYHGKQADLSRLLAFDMGGTTAKLCLVHDGAPELGYGLEVARVHRFKRGSGLPIRTPSVHLIEIGAGGGSIARVDELGLLTVGPESAGADPGPACYGFGGAEPTVTDADLLLGYLNPANFLGGAMPLDPEAALRAVEERLAGPLGLDALQCAWGIHDVVNENMATAAGVYIADSGHDPRDYTLLATGGAGPVHAVEVARKIGLAQVLIPPAAGVASALGLLVAAPRIDLAQSYLVRLAETDWPRVNRLFAEAEWQAREVLLGAGVAVSAVRVERVVDLRYTNQGHEVPVPLPDEPHGPETLPEILEAFEAVYAGRYGRTIPGIPVEAVTWRLTANGPAPESPSRTAQSQAGTRGAVSGERPVYFPDFGEPLPVPIYNRYGLRPGDEGNGPAVIEERESTIVVGPHDRFRVDARGNVLVELGARSVGGGEE